MKFICYVKGGNPITTFPAPQDVLEDVYEDVMEELVDENGEYTGQMRPTGERRPTGEKRPTGEQYQDFAGVAATLGITEYELVDASEVEAWRARNTPKETSIAETVNACMQKVQDRLDAFARTKTYDNMLSACTYATSANPVFQVEGQYCVQMRDATWAAAQAFLNAAREGVVSGDRDIPAWEEVEAALPALAWPEWV